MYNRVKWRAIKFPSSKAGLYLWVLKVCHTHFPLQNYRFSNCDCFVVRCAFGQTTAVSNYRRARPRSQEYCPLHCTFYHGVFSLHTSSLQCPPERNVPNSNYTILDFLQTCCSGVCSKNIVVMSSSPWGQYSENDTG